MKQFELTPFYGQKSYYGKASVCEVNTGNKYLRSYKTIVAMIDKDGIFHKLWDGYSATTAKHIHTFRILYCLDGICKKEWDCLPAEHDYISDHYKIFGMFPSYIPEYCTKNGKTIFL